MVKTKLTIREAKTLLKDESSVIQCRSGWFWNPMTEGYNAIYMSPAIPKTWHCVGVLTFPAKVIDALHS